MRWLIDGYNVCFAVGLVPFQVQEGDLRKARIGLLNAISVGLPADQVAQTVVVFDAREALNLPEEPYVATFPGKVLFASDSPDADAVIEKLLAAESAPEKLGVVSSDGRIVKAATRRRARSFAADAWWDALREGRLTPRAPALSKPLARPLPSSTETADWAKAFAVDETALQAEIAAETLRSTPKPAAKPTSPSKPASAKPTQTTKGKDDLPDEWRDFAARLDAGEVEIGDVPGEAASSAANPFGAGYADDLLADTSWLDKERSPKKRKPGE